MLDSVIATEGFAAMLDETKIDMFQDQSANEACERVNAFVANMLRQGAAFTPPTVAEQIALAEDSILVIEGQIALLETDADVRELLDGIHGAGTADKAIEGHRTNIALGRVEIDKLREQL